MLMANLKAVLTHPKVSESYARNAFDRSFSPKVHYQLGALQPFFAEPVIAGSHMKINRSIFQRTAAVNTAAFPKVDTHCEFFYVPLRLLWSYWNNFKLNIQDYNSTYFGSVNSVGTFIPNAPSTVPQFNLVGVQQDIVSWMSGMTFTAQYLTQGVSQAVGANRLLDAFGYGFCKTGWTVNPQQGTLPNFMVNPFKLLAYQKVYYDHFRNTAYENNDPSYYNVDDATGLTISNETVAKMLTLRYVNYRKDYFQAVYPALNYTSSLPDGSSWVISDSVVGASGNFGLTGSNLFASVLNKTPSPVIQANSAVSSGGVPIVYNSVQQIRAAFALDRLLRASACTPKHVKDQFEARYGVKGVESGNESIRIGAYMNDIVFQEVTNMADTSNNLGEIGGKGVGYQGFGKDIEFTAKEDGIVIGLIYSLPRSSYDSDCIRQWNTKNNREDFFIPEFMDLGMQPLPWYELRWRWDTLTNINNLIGYKPRYSEYKVGIDVNHGLFNNGQMLSDFVTHSQSKYLSQYGQGGNGVSYAYFKVSPNDLDSVFVQATNTSDLTTDKFFTYLDVKFIVNQNMSVHGQPRNGGLA